jgi:G:T-mismatch repair DNA endonuclease (very short patch repair protein)
LGYLQHIRPECKIECLFNVGRQARLGPYQVDGYCRHCKTAVEVMGCFYHYCEFLRNKGKFSNIDQDKIEKKRAFDAEKKQFLEISGHTVIQIWECQWKELLKTSEPIKSFPTLFPELSNPISHVH